MIRNSLCGKLSLGCVGLLLMLCVSTHRASSQVSFPGLHSDPHLSFFGTFTNLKPDYQYYGDYAAVGVPSGVFMQTSHILGGGVEMENSASRGGAGTKTGRRIRAAMVHGRWDRCPPVWPLRTSSGRD